MSSRNILLIEPKYRNKYPPVGLMKIATYHKMLNDNVSFFKGDLKKLILEIIYEKCLNQLQSIDSSIKWNAKSSDITDFIRRKSNRLLNDEDILSSENSPLINNCLFFYKECFVKKKYKDEGLFDRIYVTTLFTFDWKVTIETILLAKTLVRNPQDSLKIGGIMASLLPNEIEQETGIKPIIGPLDKPNILDSNEIIVDDLPLDYSILDEIDYIYPTGSAYFGMMTKGCTRNCPFCSVPKLEPTYIPKLPANDRFSKVRELYGEQRHLLLMDNNILASPNLAEIVQEIKNLGFYKGATYTEPNQLDIAIKNLKEGINDKAYIKRSFLLIHKILKKSRGKTREDYYSALYEHNLLKLETTTKEQLIVCYPKIQDTYEMLRYKKPVQRFVDFNQGTDCRYITEEVIKIISEIPVRPLRIAFDYFGLKERYIKAVELAAQYDIKELSNYILYNFHDTPEELYRRLEINQDLSDRLNLHIYSFPMKYIPLEPKGRDHIGKHWNRKFIRAIQSIINVTKGIVAPSRNSEKGDFFKKAFGKNIEEFKQILYMPENYIVYRKLFEEDLNYTAIWQKDFERLNLLSKEEKDEVYKFIEFNEFNSFKEKFDNPIILKLLEHYVISKDASRSLSRRDGGHQELKRRFDKLIKSDALLNLTITYDYS